MKTTSITVERNFHILNEDRFLMEKISMTAELNESDDTQNITDVLRAAIEHNFRAAYPYMEEHLNFFVVRQVNGEHISKKDTNNIKSLTGKIIEPTVYNNTNPTHYEVILPPEKINKGTIEEQIEACTEIEGKEDHCLKSFEMFVGMNKKYKPIYDKKLKELSNGVVQQ